LFDAVFIARDAGPAVLSPDEFLALPLNERARSLLENKVEFRRNGLPVPVVEVMKGLMRQALRSP
jgi:hypothetical protein